MPQPGRSQIHYSRPLTTVSTAYIQDNASEFAHNQVFSHVPVKKQSDRYYVYAKEDWFRAVAAKRAPASESIGVSYTIDNSPSYFCDIWAVHRDIPWSDYGNADDGIDLDRDATKLVTQNLLLRRELLFLRTYMQPNVWTGYTGSAGDFTPAEPWDTAGSNPIAEVKQIIRRVQSQTGRRPNKMVLSPNVLTSLESHPLIIDRIKHTSSEPVSKDLIGRLFGLDLIEAGAVLNSAQEGQAANMGFMSSNTALIAYANPSPGLLQPSAGYIFDWTGQPGGSGEFGQTIDRFDIREKKCTRVEGEMTFDFAQTGRDLGVLMTNVLTEP